MLLTEKFQTGLYKENLDIPDLPSVPGKEFLIET